MPEKLYWLKDFYPGYFAMTMATGIISVAFYLHDNILLSNNFMILTIMTWCVMTFLYTWRLIKFPKTVFGNLTNPRTTFTFFTLSLIHISEPTRPLYIPYAVFCLKKHPTVLAVSMKSSCSR